MNPQPLISITSFIVSLIDRILVPLIFTIAFLVFIWGVFQFFFATGSDSEEKRKEGKKFITYGIIGFFVMMSIWGIVNIFVYTFGFNFQSRPDLPTFDASARTNGPTILFPRRSGVPDSNGVPAGAPIGGPTGGVTNPNPNPTECNDPTDGPGC